MTEINLIEYLIMKDEKGDVIIEYGYVFLKHNITGEIIKAAFEDVAAFYNLAVVAEDQENYDPNIGLTASSTGFNVWSHDLTKLMLNIYKENMDQIGPLKKLKNKKQLWETIAREMQEKGGSTFNATQIENRFKNVVRRNKTILTHNKTSGSSLKSTPYDAEMSQIAALDDSIEPELILTPTVVRRKQTISESRDKPESHPQSSRSSAARNPSGSPLPNLSQSPVDVLQPHTSERRPRMNEFQSEMLEMFKQFSVEKKLQKERSERLKEERHKERIQAVNSQTSAILELAKSIEKRSANFF